jgi:hypothetical protein
MPSTFVLSNKYNNPVLKSNIKSRVNVTIPAGTQKSKQIIHYRMADSFTREVAALHSSAICTWCVVCIELKLRCFACKEQELKTYIMRM